MGASGGPREAQRGQREARGGPRGAQRSPMGHPKDPKEAPNGVASIGPGSGGSTGVRGTKGGRKRTVRGRLFGARWLLGGKGVTHKGTIA